MLARLLQLQISINSEKMPPTHLPTSSSRTSRAGVFRFIDSNSVRNLKEKNGNVKNYIHFTITIPIFFFCKISRVRFLGILTDSHSHESVFALDIESPVSGDQPPGGCEPPPLGQLTPVVNLSQHQGHVVVGLDRGSLKKRDEQIFVTFLP